MFYLHIMTFINNVAEVLLPLEIGKAIARAARRGAVSPASRTHSIALVTRGGDRLSINAMSR